jgi:hypothetical protein
VMTRVNAFLFGRNVEMFVYYDAFYHTIQFSPFKNTPKNIQIKENVNILKSTSKLEAQAHDSMNIELANINPQSKGKQGDEGEKMLVNNNFMNLDSLYRRKNEKLDTPDIDEEKLKIYESPFKIEFTRKELVSLQISEIIENDKRGCLSYYYDWLVNYNNFFNAFFLKSLIYPSYIRVLIFLLNINIQFTLNAMLFTDDYIDQILINKIKYGFSFVFTNQFEKCVYSLLLARIPIFLLRFLYIPDDRTRKNFNESLISKNASLIARA